MKNGKQAVLFLSLVLLPGTSGLSRQHSPQQEAKDEGEECCFHLVGQLEVEAGQPLKGTFATLVLRDAYRPFLQRRVSDLGGRFKFKKIPQGTYVLSARTPDNAISSKTVVVSSSFADSKGRVSVTLEMGTPNADRTRSVSIAELSVPEKAWKAYEKAQKMLSRRDLPGAIRLFEKAVEISPVFPSALNYLGTIAFQTQQFEKAKTYFERALAQDSQAYPPLVNLGGVLVSLGDYGRALDVNLEATRRRPQDPLGHAQLGLSYEGLGEMEKAIVSLERAKQLEPAHFSSPQLILGRIYVRTGRREEAIKEFESFLALHPDSPSAPLVRRFIERGQP